MKDKISQLAKSIDKRRMDAFAIGNYTEYALLSEKYDSVTDEYFDYIYTKKQRDKAKEDFQEQSKDRLNWSRLKDLFAHLKKNR